MKCQSCHGAQTHTHTHTASAFSLGLARIIQRQAVSHAKQAHRATTNKKNRRRRRRKEESAVKFFHLVLCSVSPSVFFHLPIYLSPRLFSFPTNSRAPPSPPPRQICHSSSFVATPRLPPPPLNSPPSPLLWLSRLLSGA